MWRPRHPSQNWPLSPGVKWRRDELLERARTRSSCTLKVVNDADTTTENVQFDRCTTAMACCSSFYSSSSLCLSMLFMHGFLLILCPFVLPFPLLVFFQRLPNMVATRVRVVCSIRVARCVWLHLLLPVTKFAVLHDLTSPSHVFHIF